MVRCYFGCGWNVFPLRKRRIFYFKGRLDHFGRFFRFCGHILVIDYFSPKVDGVCLSCLQFFICGMICAIPMLVSEQPTVNAVLVSWRPIVYAGVLSSGVGYTLQIIAQKNTDPTVASLLMSLESVFAVLAGWVILGERLSVRGICGMRTGILSSDSCPAPGTESSQFRKSDSFRINCRVAEYDANA